MDAVYGSQPLAQQQYYPTTTHSLPLPIQLALGAVKRPNEDPLPMETHKRPKTDSSLPEMINLLSDDEEDSALGLKKPGHVGHDSAGNVQPSIPTPKPVAILATNPINPAKTLVQSTIVVSKTGPKGSRIDHAPPVFDLTGHDLSLGSHSPYVGPVNPLTPPSSSPPNGPDRPSASGALVSDEPPLCPEQTALVELVASGRNVFYTGSAGCGKSTALKAITRRLQSMGKTVRIAAPTGRAALQVNGTTTWSFAGWTPDHHKRTLDELCAGAHGRFVWKRLTETDVLILDEISMVENLHFERLNAVMKEARNNKKAFGGVQLIVTGDFCQLPPVKPFQHCIQCGHELTAGSSDSGFTFTCSRHGAYFERDKWAFRARAWEECNFVHVQLTTIHRQSDEAFIRILQKCRIGEELASSEVDLLMDHECMVHHATKLFATRDEVNKVNRIEFEKLKGLKHTYWCLDNFFWHQDRHPHLQWKSVRKAKGPQSQGPLRALEDHRFSECVELKKGMLVVLLVNLDLASGLCNGSQGIICGFERNDPKKLPKAKTLKEDPINRIFGDRAPIKEQQIKLFIEDPGVRYKTWPVVRFHNGQVRTLYADCSIAELGDSRPYSLLARTQIPLAPAWAMTIHKSQSLTLDRVIVNLSKAFEEGQVYVALSRATGLKGLKIEGDSAGLLAGLGGNKEVQEFLRGKFGGVNARSSITQ